MLQKVSAYDNHETRRSVIGKYKSRTVFGILMLHLGWWNDKEDITLEGTMGLCVRLF